MYENDLTKGNSASIKGWNSSCDYTPKIKTFILCVYTKMLTIADSVVVFFCMIDTMKTKKKNKEENNLKVN